MPKTEPSYQPIPADEAKEMIEQWHKSRVPSMIELAEKVLGRKMSEFAPVVSNNHFYSEIPPTEAKKLMVEFNKARLEGEKVPTPEEYYDQVIGEIKVSGLKMEKSNPALRQEISRTLINVSQRLREIIAASGELKKNIFDLCKNRLEEWSSSFAVKSADEKLMREMESQALQKLSQAELLDKEMVQTVVEIMRILSRIKESAGQRDKMYEQSAIYFKLAENLREKLQLQNAKNKSNIIYNEKVLKDLSRFNIA